MKYTYLLLLFCIVGFSCNDNIEPYEEVQEEIFEEEEWEDEEETDLVKRYSPILEKINPKRMLWASVNSNTETGTGIYKNEHNKKILVSWRLLPTDNANITFDLYRKNGNGERIKLNTEPIQGTNFQDVNANLEEDNTYYLTRSGWITALDIYTMKAAQSSKGLPYISIPLKGTADVGSYSYMANDASVGDLDGDGVYEVIVKRLYGVVETEGDEEENTEGVPMKPAHLVLLEAYRLDGTFLWRLKMGPNILSNNGLSFAVYDFDDDGRCEVAVRTSEGTVFGDGTAIGDVDGDGKTDYRVAGSNYIKSGPEFLSVIEGMTGRELARTNYIPRGTSEEWGDNYFKRASSYRLGVAKCEENTTSILIARGAYKKIVVEAWNYKNGELKKCWNFDTDKEENAAYAGQGFHSLSVGDVDNDGKDEIVYGACTIDHDGKGLNSCGYGHGDALHLGVFDSSQSDLQIWSCFEAGAVGAAFRNGATGHTIWKYDNSGDVGRCLVADIDPESPGCEMWWYHGNAHTPGGADLGYNPGSSNMAIWWSGSLNRQLLDGTTIDAPRGEKGRVFTIYKYNVSTNNASKKNPCFYGDIVGDWREEIIMRSSDNAELRVFSTWFPTDYRFPYLMSDHVYAMSALNQNIGYNQPTQTGYYLGSDLLNE